MLRHSLGGGAYMAAVFVHAVQGLLEIKDTHCPRVLP